MNLREAVNVIWRRRSLILVVALLGPLAVWLVGRPAGSSEQTYSASVSITATTSDNADGSPIPQYAFIATDTLDIAAGVAVDMNEIDPERGLSAVDIVQMVEITPLPEINIMTISVAGEPNEDVVRALVESYARHLIGYINEQRQQQATERTATLTAREADLRDQVSTLSAEVKAARARLTAAEIAAGVSADPVKEAELEVASTSLSEVLAELDSIKLGSGGDAAELRATPANIRADPMESNPLGLNARLLLALLLGAGLGVGLAFALHRFDTRLYSRKDAEAGFGLPVLAEIPSVSWLRRRNWQLIARSHPEAPASEAYRLLRSSLAQAARLAVARPGSADRGSTVILVTSVSDQVGKSATVANLAVAAVDARKSVLVVSADLRQPTVHLLLGAQPGPGLTDAADQIEEDGLAAVDLDDYLTTTSVRGTTLIRSGHPVPHPGERLAISVPLIHEARKRFDLIIIDTPAMLLGNDVAEMITAVDLVLLVARAGVSTLEEAEWSRETAERLQAPVCGVAFIGSSPELYRRGRLLTTVSRLTRRVLGRPTREQDLLGIEAASPEPESPEQHPPAPLPPSYPGTSPAAVAAPLGPATPRPLSPIEVAAATTQPLSDLIPSTGAPPAPFAATGQTASANGAAPSYARPDEPRGQIAAEDLLADLVLGPTPATGPAGGQATGDAPAPVVPDDASWLNVVDASNGLIDLIDEDEMVVDPASLRRRRAAGEPGSG